MVATDEKDKKKPTFTYFKGLSHLLSKRRKNKAPIHFFFFFFFQFLTFSTPQNASRLISCPGSIIQAATQRGSTQPVTRPTTERNMFSFQKLLPVNKTMSRAFQRMANSATLKTVKVLVVNYETKTKTKQKANTHSETKHEPEPEPALELETEQKLCFTSVLLTNVWYYGVTGISVSLYNISIYWVSLYANFQGNAK